MRNTPLIYNTFFRPYKLTIDKRGITCSFTNVEIAQCTNLIIMVTNCSGKRSFSKLKYLEISSLTLLDAKVETCLVCKQ